MRDGGRHRPAGDIAPILAHVEIRAVCGPFLEFDMFGNLIAGGTGGNEVDLFNIDPQTGAGTFIGDVSLVVAGLTLVDEAVVDAPGAVAR